MCKDLLYLIKLQLIKKLLVEGKVNVNHRNDIGEAPIHTLVRKARGAKKNTGPFECLWTYLVYCDSTKFDINIQSEQEWNTALHIAAEVSASKLISEYLLVRVFFRTMTWS